MNHISVGVYSNGDYVVNIVKEEDLIAHIEYNRTFRFGRALFVDGKCLNEGYLSDNQISYWINKIKNMTFNTTIASKVYV